jgi:hypothetical protein
LKSILEILSPNSKALTLDVIFSESPNSFVICEPLETAFSFEKISEILSQNPISSKEIMWQ